MNRATRLEWRGKPSREKALTPSELAAGNNCRRLEECRASMVSTQGLPQSFPRPIGGFFFRLQQDRTNNAQHEPDRLFEKIRLDHVAPEQCKPLDGGLERGEPA